MDTHAPVGVDIRPLTIPSRIDDDDAQDFIEMTRVRNEVYREISGHDDERIAAAELLPHYQPDEYETRLIWTVRDNGRIVGRCGIDLPHENMPPA